MITNAPTILVVEDDAIVRMLIVDVLEELEFKVLEADGSEQALELIKDMGQHIDLMICLLYTSPSPRDRQKSRMPSSA